MSSAARRIDAGLSTGPTSAGYGLGPIDMVHLARQTLGDGALERELLAMFRTVCDGQMKRLSGAEATSETALVLHALKGAAAGVGAHRVAALAKSCEARLNSSGRLDAESRADLAHAVAETDAYIAGLLTD